ncbi:MAG: TrkH family potassium uptake protein [Acetivibrionales bacterium]
MNFKIILRSLGTLLVYEAVSMLPSLLVSVLYREPSAAAFVYSIIILLAVGLPLVFIKPSVRNFFARDGFAIVAMGWVLVSFFGALPAFISGDIPSLADSFFESVSGFTTTGVSFLTDIESLPKGIIFWRSSTIWIGGMGVLMLTIAILPMIGAKSFHIMKAESPGPNPGKLVPKIGQTAKILYGIYIGITLVEVLLLLLAGLPLYDSLIHAFGTASTGGFSNMNASVGSYNNVAVEVIITVFMLIFGTNFALHYQALKGNIKSYLKNEEFRLYIGLTVVSVILVAVNINGSVFNNIWESVRHSTFQVASIITTTGYFTQNFDMWPVFSKVILITLMFIGGCASSTGGGIKSIRVLLLIKTMKRELIRIIHPRAVHTIKIEGKVVEEETLTGILSFFFMYIFIFVIAVLIVSIDGNDVTTTVTSVIASIGNSGLGLAAVGPMGNFAGMSIISKLVLSMCMIIGRLEIYPILLLMLPSFWKRVNI